MTEIPVFVKLGAMLPSTPLRLGKSVGQASRPLEELEFTIYGVPAAKASGTASVYEDDGNSTAYVTSKTFARTIGHYTLDDGMLTFSVSSAAAGDDGELDAGLPLPAAIPAARPYTLKLVNAMPPTSVTVDGKPVPFSRYPPSRDPTEFYHTRSGHFWGIASWSNPLRGRSV